jgi:hypothetical protein
MTQRLDISESPFLNVRSFEVDHEFTAERRLGLSSPFVEAFTAEPRASASNSPDAPRSLLLAELYDDEFTDALYELVGEATAHAGVSSTSRLNAAALQLRFAPLADEIETYLQRAAEAFGTRSAATFSDAEIDDVLERIGPERQLSPAFEHFLGSIKKAASRVAKGAANLAKKGLAAAQKLGLGPIMEKLKKLVRPLLERVLKAAIDRLPSALQPVATQLAGKLPALFGKELEPAEEPALAIGHIQSEFNEQIAQLLLGESDIEYQAETGGWRASEYGSGAGIADLDAARERFIGDLEQLDDGDDAGPAVDRFVPALLPALKLGIQLAGRKRVVKMLAGLVAKLIGRFVGPAASGALSSALVDTGLKMIGLEVSEADPRKAANAALAATVEDTVRRVAALPDAVLDNETLLEGSVLRAFEEAATANLPPMLPADVYRRRPDLAETDARHGTWIPCPLRGPVRYKKFSRVLNTRITPRVAMGVATFGEAPLAQYLQEQLGLEPGEDLDAEVHLYEAVPGSVVGEIAHYEANGNGAARSVEFHPLTPEAAALLLREPGLGRVTSPASRASAANLVVGQRFYRLAVPGRRLAALPRTGASARPRRGSSLYTVFDFPGDRIRLFLFLSERRAQESAATLRKQGHAGTVAMTLKSLLERGLNAVSNAGGGGRLRLIHEALSLEEARGAALGKLPGRLMQAFTARIGEWTLSALTDYLAAQTARFIAATEDAQDGVTVIVTLANPPGMAALRKALDGASANGDGRASGGPAAVQVDVQPGFRNG